MILVYTKHTSNRLSYTLDVLFKHILKTDYTIVTLEEFIVSKHKVKLNYSTERIDNCISIKPHSLLFQKEITPQLITVEWTKEIPYFFKTAINNTFIYDILASTFFMVSRYEEYNAKDLDNHNRFKAENSLAYKNKFLKLPVVNLWAHQLKGEILKLDSEYNFPKLKYKHLNSIDIDVAYAYKGKNIFRLLGSTVKSLIQGNKDEINNRYQYFIKSKKDPYDVYSFIESLQKKFNTTNLYFFLIGNYNSFDKNLSHTSTVYKSLIKNICQKNEIGIHPSYQSNANKNSLEVEINRLETVSSKKIIHSRQHYLKLAVPFTYENLIAHNIKHDYSMGFASQIGFRAGICISYPFFNVDQDQQSTLMILPFQIMDGTLNQYLKLTPNDAIEKIQEIVMEIKKINGTFVSLWHNSSLAEINEWKNWKNVYLRLQEIAKHDD